MGRILKIVLGVVAAAVALLVVAVLIIAVTFDPNDYKDEIIAEVEARTGRSLEIDGDIGLSLFPVLAVDVGAVRFGNAPGFDSSEHFASLDGAKVSIRVLPALLRREIRMGNVVVDSLQLNLAINETGRSNWADLAEAGEESPAEDAPAEGGVSMSSLEVAGLEIVDSVIRFSDASSASAYSLSDVNLSSGRIAAGEALDLSGGFAFSALPAELSGVVDVAVTAAFDESRVLLSDIRLSSRLEGLTDVPADVELNAAAIELDLEQQRMSPGVVDIDALGVDMTLDVKPFNYGDSPSPQAKISVATFSPKSLMQTLGLDPLQTADPDALEKLSIEALAYMGSRESGLNDLVIRIDDTTLRGRIAFPAGNNPLRIALAGDSIDLTRYMAPAGEDAADAKAEQAPVEIPTELIRAFDIDATFRLDEARLGDMRFTGMELSARSTDGNLHLYPISAKLFDGEYAGDVRVDASGPETALSVNETISNVSLAPLVAALFKRDNITGSINGNFQLKGKGQDLDAIRRDLDGTMRFTLSDGAFEGTDVWHQLRSTRARIKGEAPPEPKLPPRTEFSEVKATGVVTDGVLQNDDFFAELPFLRLNGRGSVSFVEATVDYSMTARVLERPEFVAGATDEEIAEFTEAVIPLKITGPLAAPKIRPDIEGMLKDRVRDEAKKKVLDKLLGDGEEPPAEGEKDAEDILKDKLKDLFKR